MLGAVINALAILLGGGIGLLCKQNIPERITTAVMHVLGVFVLSIGITGIFKGQNLLVLPVSIVMGTIVGELLDIDGAVNRLGDHLSRKFHTSSGNFAQGFVTATLIYCVGAMGMVGSIQAGTTGDLSLLTAKSALDGIEAVMLSATLGVGVLVSAAGVLLVEGGITLLAGILAPVLTEAMIAEMTCVGSLMVMVVGLNIMDVTKFKAANYLPALLFTPFITALFTTLGIG